MAEDDEEQAVEAELTRQEALATSWVFRMLDLWGMIAQGTLHKDGDGGESVAYKIKSWSPLMRLSREWPYSQDRASRTIRAMKAILHEMNRPTSEVMIWHSTQMEAARDDG